MRRFNTLIFTIVLMIALLITEVVIIRSASSYEPVTGVVFASSEIPAGTEIVKEMLKIKKINLGLVHPKAIRDIGQATGKKALVDIEAGEMVLSSRVGIIEEMESIRVTDGKNRLFTVEFKGDQANGWWIMVGQYVDILFVPNPPNSAEPGSNSLKKPEFEFVKGSETETPVKRLNHIRIAALIDDKGALVKNSKRTTLPRYISFEVDERQDEFLAYAKSNGRLEISVIPED